MEWIFTEYLHPLHYAGTVSNSTYRVPALREWIVYSRGRQQTFPLWPQDHFSQETVGAERRGPSSTFWGTCGSRRAFCRRASYWVLKDDQQVQCLTWGKQRRYSHHLQGVTRKEGGKEEGTKGKEGWDGKTGFIARRKKITRRFQIVDLVTIKNSS